MHRSSQEYGQRYAPQRPKPNRKIKRGITLVSVLVVAILAALVVKELPPSLQAKVHLSALSAAALPRKQAPVNRVVLATQINKVINSPSLEIGVSIIDT